MDNAEAWAALGELLLKRRIELGHPKRAPFAEAAGFRNDRVLFDLEKGRRDNYDPATIAHVERAYQWAPGSINEYVFMSEDPVPMDYSKHQYLPEERLFDDVFDRAQFKVPSSREEAAGRLSAVSAALQQAWERSAVVAHELELAMIQVARLRAEAADLDQRRETLSAEQRWLNRLLMHQRTDGVWVLDGSDDFDLVADDADGHDHQDEDEQRETEA